MKDKSKETADEEKKESPVEEKKEVDSGAEGIIPEEFQQKVLVLISECDDRQCLSFIREAVSRKEDELRKAEMSKSKGKKVPDEYSMSDAPSMG